MGQNSGSLLQENNYTTSYWLNTVTFYNMPKLKSGKYYNQKLEIKIPRDTINSRNGKIMRVKIKNIDVIGVFNVPEGLSYSPSIVDNSGEKFFRFYIQIYGRAVSISSAPITAKLSVTFSRENGKSIVRTYDIKNILIQENNTQQFETYDDKVGLKSLKSYPNPMNNKTEVSFWSSKLQIVEFEVRDAIGNLKFKKTFTAKVGSNKVSFSQKDLPNGLYLYSITSEEQILAKRLIVK